jgi:hypothetical protein
LCGSQALGSERKQLVVLGPAPFFAHHYGHLDMLCGRNVRAEVCPHITTFLLALDDPAFHVPDDIALIQVRGRAGSRPAYPCAREAYL